jgi:Holliday junction resolvase
MSIHRRAARRDKNEKEIIEALRQAGASVTQISEKGAPDLLVGFRGQTYLLETKTARGKLTEDQQHWVSTWQGHQAVVVRTVEAALIAIGAMN